MDAYDNFSNAPDHGCSQQRYSMIERQAQEGVVLFAVRACDADDILARVRHMLPEGSLLYVRHETAGAPDVSLVRRLSALTDRQRDILRLLMRGLSNKEIARRLRLSHFTVRNHVSQLLRLLNVSSRKAAVVLLNDIIASDDHILPPSD